MIELRARLVRCVFLGAVTMLAARMVSAEEVEVLHYWRPDASATELLKEMLRKQGHTWKDFSIIPGGTNGLLNSLLKSRVLHGNPPFAAVIRAPVARQWAREGKLTNLDEVAALGQWDKVLPKVVRDAVKLNGHYVAVPVNIYRGNWLWLNNRLLQRAGAKVPTDWESFFGTAETLRRAGMVAVAHSGQQRQNLHLFESVALGVGGPEFYRKAFVLHETASLSGSLMEEALLTLRRIKPYTQVHLAQRDWPEVSKGFIDNEAAMAFMGDWTKPMFAAAKSESGFDFTCIPAPGTAGTFTYLIDSFAMFRPQNPAAMRAQREFASGVLMPAIQVQFNLDQGSIPVRQGTDLSRFDGCGKQAASAFRKAVESNTLVPSFALAVSASVEVAMAEVVSAFWNDDSMTPKMAMELLVAVMK